MRNELAEIAELKHPSHSCLIYENRDDQIAVTGEFLARGLTRGEQCVFLETPEILDLARRELAGKGVNVTEEEKRGALVLTSSLGFLFEGHFHGGRTIAFLEDTVKRALSDGYTGLRATGDMNWELGQDQDFPVLIDYEANLDAFVSHHPIVGLCQYRRPSIPGLPIKNALETHERVVLGRLLCTNNLFYQPPSVRLETDALLRQERHLAWMCKQLGQATHTERQRDAALRGLLEKEDRLNDLMKSLNLPQ